MPRLSILSVFFVSLFLGAFSFAQNMPSSGTDSGFYMRTAIGTNHDSTVGWSAELDNAVGYDFNRYFSAEAGVPLFLVAGKSTTTSNGVDSTTTHYGSLGDAFLNLNLNPHLQALSYWTNLTVTAPTGDTAAGLSTGRAAVKWNNHIQKDFGRVAPFIELGTGNSQASTVQTAKPYTTLGAYAAFRGGLDFDLGHHFSLGTSAYYTRPFGTQKVYSRIVKTGVVQTAAGAGTSHGKGKGLTMAKNRPFQTAYLVVGDASLTKDHGFSGSLDINPSRRVDVELAYDRSQTYALDTVSLTLAFRLGHLPRSR